MIHRLIPRSEGTRTSIHYFSRLLKRPVVDGEGEPVGILVDLLASAQSRGLRVASSLTGHAYVPPPAPLLLGLLIATGDGQLLCVHPTQVESGGGRQIHLRCPREMLSAHVAQLHAVRLATTVLNRDVMDLVKKQVVLVNDIALDDEWHLLGLDGSPFGVLHWLLPQRFWERIVPPLGGALLPWGHVALLPGDTQGEDHPEMNMPAALWSLRRLPPTELAELVQQLTPKEGSRILAALDATTAVATLADFALPDQILLFKQTERSCALRLLEAMKPGMAADLLSGFPEHEAQHLLEQMTAVRAAEVQRFLGYPNASAGRLMTTHALLLDQEDTVAVALRQVRHVLLEGHGSVEMAYVADTSVEEGLPAVVGAIPLGELLAADSADFVRDLVHTPLISVRPDTELHTVAERMNRYHVPALPVLDADGQIQGVIRMADVFGRLLRMPQRRLHHLSPGTRTIL